MHQRLRRLGLLNFFFILILSSFGLQGMETGTEVRVLQSGPDRIVLEFTPGDFLRADRTLQTGTSTMISLPGEGMIMKHGEPELPRVTRSVIIPDQAKMALRILDETWSTETGIMVIPSRGHLTRDIDPSTIPITFGPAYSRDAYYPAETVVLHEPFILRDMRGIHIEIHPFQFNPARKTMRVLEKMTLELYPEGFDAANSKDPFRERRPFDPAFSRIYKTLFLNYGHTTGGSGFIGENGSILVVTHDGFASAVQPLVDWKILQSIPTTMVSISQIGNTPTRLKNYLSSVYNSPDRFTYVVLVGDAGQIPVMRGTAENAPSDPTYVMLEGSDLYPDAFISRISANNAAEVSIQVQKIIHYEQNLHTMPSETWYTGGCGIASNEGSPSDAYRCDLLRDRLLGYIFTRVDRMYQGQGGSTQGITNALNEGRSIVNYIGHGSGTAWSSVYFSNNHVNNLQNHNKLPFIIDVACQNGDFAGHNACFAETWLRANDNGLPTGAVAMYSASTNASWVPPCVMQSEVVDNFIAEEMMSIGEIYFSGAVKALETYGGYEGRKLMEQYNIFGDCSMRIHPSGGGIASLYTAPGPGLGNVPEIRGFDAEGTLETSFAAYNATSYGAEIATGVLLDSGVSYIITGPGPGPRYGPFVRAFSQDGTPCQSCQFLSYGVKKYGTKVCSGDIDGDGKDEILTAPGPGNAFGPHVRAWDVRAAGVTPIGAVNFLPFNTGKGGGEVASGDIDGDGYDEILVGPGHLAHFGSHLKGFDYDGNILQSMPGLEYFAYAGLKYGLNITAGDLDADGQEDIVTAPGPCATYGAFIRGWKYDRQNGSDARISPLSGFSFFAYDQGTKYGADVSCGLYPGEKGKHMLFTAPGPGEGNRSHIRGWNYVAGAIQSIPGINFFAYGAYGYGGHVAGEK